MPSQQSPDLSIRLIVDDPLPHVALALQRGKDGLDPPTAASARHVVFDFAVRLGKPQAGGQLNFLGPYTQGPVATRFVYICVGRRAGQANSSCDGRTKIPLTGITPALVQALLATPGKRLAVQFPGRSTNGGPAYATVRLAADAWKLVDEVSA